MQGVATLLPKEELVVEILEDVQPTPAILEACLGLKRQGYTLALDDFVDTPAMRPFVEMADIIKVDFILSDAWERRSVIRSLGNGKIRFLAEKIETQEEFEQAKEMGYTLFQGFFFSRPVIQPMGEIPTKKVNQLRLLELLNKREIDYSELSGIVTQDVSLAYKLLKLLGMELKWKGKTADLFLLGLFSCLDVLMNRPLPELLEGVSVSDEVKAALLLREGGRREGMLHGQRQESRYRSIQWNSEIHALVGG